MGFRVGQIWRMKVAQRMYGWPVGHCFMVNWVDFEGDVWVTAAMSSYPKGAEVCVCKSRIVDGEVELVKDIDDE